MMTANPASHWSYGYMTEIAYPSKYFRELSPLYQAHALRFAQILAPQTNAPKYLEIGYGNGMALNAHAAAQPGEFWGTEFNPTHASLAMEFAAESQAPIQILGESFEELLARRDLPQFDYIALHGVWSWISADNRSIIMDVVRRHLRPGGVVYLCYNVHPGCSHFAPLRDLMVLYAERACGKHLGIEKKIEQTIQFCQRLAGAGAEFFRANESVIAWLDSLQEKSRNYLAHEYFNLDWELMSFAQLEEICNAAKLTYATSVSLQDQLYGISAPAACREMLAEYTDTTMRETIKDFFCNEKLRKDLLVSGKRFIPNESFLEDLDSMQFALTAIPQIPTPESGKITLQESIYPPLQEALGEEQGTRFSFADLRKKLEKADISRQGAIRAIMAMLHNSEAAPAQSEETVDMVQKRVQKLNRFLCKRARFMDDIEFLVAPLTGGVVGVRRFSKLFLLALEEGKKGKREIANYVWQIFSEQGKKIIKDQKTLTTAAENISELQSRYDDFSKNELRFLKRLGCV